MASTDASKKILGFKYQELVALHKCLTTNASQIFLECYGDVSDGKTSTEVKHSIDTEKELIDTHIDFWKTLFNIIDEYNSTYSTYDKFILHTTAKLRDTTIFSEWISYSGKLKRTKILSITPTDTIKKYYDAVKAFNSTDLERILSCFEIHAEQPSAKNYFNDKILAHPVIVKTLAKEEDRYAIVLFLLGYISEELIDANNFRWTININSFNENFQAQLKKYLIEDLIFPNIKRKYEVDTDTTYSFVKKIQDIKYDAKIGLAMSQYLSAQENQVSMIKSRFNLAEVLDEFDEEIEEEAFELKLTHNEYIKEEDNLIEKSKRYFDECIAKSENKTTIIGIKGIKPYYPKGRLYHCFEENKDLNWKLQKK